jgi:hypothetical protein
MPQARSFQYKIALAKETTWGTGVTPTVTFPIMNGSGTPQLPATYDDGKRGLPTADFNALLDAGQGELSFEGWVYPKTIGHALVGLFGSDAVTGSSDPYTHTFSQVADVPSFTFEETYLSGTNGGVRYTGCRFSSLRLSWDASSGALQYSTQVTGKIPTVVTPANPAITEEDPFEGWRASITSTGLTSPCVVTQGEINITRELQVVHTGCDDRNPSFILVGPMRVEGSMQVAFTDMALFNLFLNGTRQSFSLTFSKGTPVRELTITCSDAFFGANPPEWDRGGVGTFMRLSFRGLYNTTDAGSCVVTLKNGQATAY